MWDRKLPAGVQLHCSCIDVTSQPHLNTECCFPRKGTPWDLWNHRTNTGGLREEPKGSIKSKPRSRVSELLLITSCGCSFEPGWVQTQGTAGEPTLVMEMEPRQSLPGSTYPLPSHLQGEAGMQSKARLQRSSAPTHSSFPEQPLKPFLPGSTDSPSNQL